MTISDLGSLGEFLGAIAVFVTLVYLTIQVRQAGRAARLTAAQANRNQRLNSFLSYRDSPYIAPIEEKLSNGQELSFEERRRLDNHLTAVWALQYGEWVQKQLSDVGDFIQNHELTTSVVLSNPLNRQWWDRRGVSLYPHPFIDYVDELARHPSQEITKALRQWRLDFRPVAEPSMQAKASSDD